MIEDVVIEPMTEDFILWRCLHDGPLSCKTIDRLSETFGQQMEYFRDRNVPLLRKIIQTYGTCAILARDGEKVVGQLRFYPKVIRDMHGHGYLCLQQDPPPGPADEFAENNFPELADIEDKTLSVNCLMTGSSQQTENPYQRKGIGTRMVETLIQWAGANGWEHIEAYALEELPLVYDVTPGYKFWEKLGFHIADRYPHPELQGEDEWLSKLEKQAKASGLSPKRARDLIIMRLDLV